MVDYFITTPSFQRSSKYWNWLNKRNIEQIAEQGYENFKQTVAANYFIWLGGLDTDYARNLVEKSGQIQINMPLKELFKKHTAFSFQDSVLFNVITVLLLDYVIKNGGSCWNKGYGKQAARLICDHGFLSLNLNRVACGTFENNIAMQKLAEYLGMVREGVRRKAIYKSGQHLDVIEYGVLRDEYFEHFNIRSKK